MTPKKNKAISSRIEDILETKLQQKNEHEDRNENFWHKTILNYTFLAAIIFLSASVVTYDLSQIIFFNGNRVGAFAFKCLVILALIIFYIKARQTVYHFLFPVANKEVIKTIYKIAPELESARQNGDEVSIRGNKNFVVNYILLGAFTILLAAIMIINPKFTNLVSGIVIESSVSATIIRIILGAFLIGIYFSVRNLILIHQEYEYLGETVWKINQVAKGKITQENIDKILPDNHESIVAERLKAIKRVVWIKGNIHTSDIEYYSTSHQKISSTMLYYLSSAMPVMGLIGTVIGLMISIGGLEKVVSMALQDQDGFSKGLGESIDGIGTAFYTTLAGSVSMLILRFFIMIVNNAHKNFIIDLTNIIAVDVLPHFSSKNESSR